MSKDSKEVIQMLSNFTESELDKLSEYFQNFFKQNGTKNVSKSITDDYTEMKNKEK